MAFAVLVLVALPLAHAVEANPTEKVVQLLSDLEAKIIGEGVGAQQVYDEFAEFCEDKSKELSFDIKTGKQNVAELKATIAEETSLMESLDAKIGDLVASIGTDEADLKAATGIREKEAADFVFEEKDLLDIIDTLSRAISILEREIAKNGASMMQIKKATNLVEALSIMVQASMLSSADGSKLTALLQTSSDDFDVGAPDASVYKGHSGNIISTIEDLKEKAETQLEDLRRKETIAIHNFEMLKQSLEDSIKFANKDMGDAKKDLAKAGQKEAAAEGDLYATSNTLAADIQSLADVHHDCMTRASDFEVETKSRAEELNALSMAKKVIKEKTGGSSSITYTFNQLSFVQRSKMSTRADLTNFEAVRRVRDLAKKQQSSALAQLAARMASAIRSCDDPFAKVKGLISSMITKLEEEAVADADHKAFCDKELAETHSKKADKTAAIEKLATAIHAMTARSSQLKGEVAMLQKALMELAKEQAEMDKLREEEAALYKEQKADMELGLDGVKAALKVLRKYDGEEGKAHSTALGAGEGIIGLLEVVEADFSKELAEIVTAEENGIATYRTETHENEIEKATREQDVKYKSKEATDLDKEITEASADQEAVKEELDAVLKYLASLEKQCIEKAETYADRKAHRGAEIAGLKEALTILGSETALIQKSHRSLRGVHVHAN